ncbi:hypothetical protein [Tautonia marina]|uniref:hypothetical protein n=1 Tax=Tautonia marina TaxID=2653855 RepID=UPI00126108BF|nr:hypothetical protein [Tautonia marina]
MDDPDTLLLERNGVTYRILLDPDVDAGPPDAWGGGWRLVSFSHRHTGYEHPSAYCKGLDAFGCPIPTSIGLARKLEVGTAFWLSYYEHSLCRWSLMGEGPQCRWDTARIAGLLLWEHPSCGLPRGFRHREADARAFLEDYTAWANGEVYSYAVERVAGRPGADGDELLDACANFYGREACLAAAEDYINTSTTEELP